MKKHIIKCRVCEKPFETYGCVGSKKFYCSRKCYCKGNVGSRNGNWKGGKEERICPVCDSIFYRHPSVSTKSCGKKCGDILKSRNSSKSNLGLTKDTAPHLMRMSVERKGKKRSPEICRNIARATAVWAKKNAFKSGNKYKDIWMRSNWEILYAKYLDKLGVCWEYEPQRFFIKKLNKYYIPDFYVSDWDLYVEIKGYEYRNSLDKYREFAKTHNAVLIMKDEMEDIIHALHTQD